jgi:hypothetical protein
MLLVRMVVVVPDSTEVTAAENDIATLRWFETGRRHMPSGHAAVKVTSYPDHLSTSQELTKTIARGHPWPFVVAPFPPW